MNLAVLVRGFYGCRCYFDSFDVSKAPLGQQYLGFVNCCKFACAEIQFSRHNACSEFYDLQASSCLLLVAFYVNRIESFKKYTSEVCNGYVHSFLNYSESTSRFLRFSPFRQNLDDQDTNSHDQKFRVQRVTPQSSVPSTVYRSLPTLMV